MTDNPFVTVKVQAPRESFQALLDHDYLVPESYTPLGVVWSTLMQQIRDALGDKP